MPKFMFLQYVDEANAPKPGSAAMHEEIAAYGKVMEESQSAKILRGGDPCQPSNATFHVQVRNGKVTSVDGPMYKASPWLNGYWVFDCKDKADAIKWAAKIPAAHGSGTVEVHPIFEM